MAPKKYLATTAEAIARMLERDDLEMALGRTVDLAGMIARRCPPGSSGTETNPTSQGYVITKFAVDTNSGDTVADGLGGARSATPSFIIARRLFSAAPRLSDGPQGGRDATGGGQAAEATGSTRTARGSCVVRPS